MDIPIQSGSNNILKKMGRSYDIDSVLSKIKQFQKIDPEIVITTQMIINFPGETIEDLKKSIQCVPIFNHVDFFDYSNHANVPAAKLTNHLDTQGRLNRLNLLSFMTNNKHSIISDNYGKSIEQLSQPQPAWWMSAGWEIDS